MDLAKYSVWVSGDTAYYPVRKAGSTSLLDAFGGTPVDLRLVPDGVLKFTWVRNPFDRLASLFCHALNYTPLWQSGIYPNMPWDEFILKVSETHDPFCDNHIWQASHHVPLDAEVFYFEDFENELARLRKFIGRDLPVKHYGRTRQPKPQYTPELEALVASRYEEDLIRFYENHRSQKGCRTGGKTAARVRQQIASGTS